MIEKGFETKITLNETPNFRVTENEPLKSENFRIKKVDINVLKARAQKVKDKQYKNNVITFTFFLTILIIAGIYLSL